MMPSTRAEAKAAGARHYFTGKPCVHGHLAPKFTSVGRCVRCSELWQQENATKKAEYDRARVARLKDQLAARGREYYAKNKEAVQARTRRWQAENPEFVRVYKRKNKVGRRAATVFTGEFQELVFSEAVALAAAREVATGIPWHVDHMEPLRARQVCGLHCAANTQVIPAALNLRKLNKRFLTQPGEWIAAMGDGTRRLKEAA